MHQIPPLPDSSTVYSDDKGRPSKDFYNWLRSLRTVFNKSTLETDLGTPVNASTVTINLANGPKQKLANNVAGFTIAAPNEVGNTELRIINGASAGAVSFSGFTKQYTSDALDTTNAHQFVVFVYGFGTTADYAIKARQ